MLHLKSKKKVMNSFTLYKLYMIIVVYPAEPLVKYFHTKILEAEEEEAKKNPMAALEKRTKDSQREMLLLENLAELTEERKAKMQLTSDIMLHKLEKSAEAKEAIDNEILTKLAREVIHKASFSKMEYGFVSIVVCEFYRSFVFDIPKNHRRKND